MNVFQMEAAKCIYELHTLSFYLLSEITIRLFLDTFYDISIDCISVTVSYCFVFVNLNNVNILHICSVISYCIEVATV